jgi:putative transferase (TIGR04331 family)
MRKKILVTNYSKLKFKRNSNLVFENEYLKKFFSEKKLKHFNTTSIETLDAIYNKKVDIFFCKGKAKRYLREIYPILNKLNNINFEKKEWETLIEYFLLISIIYLKRRFDTFKKIKDKKNTSIEANNYNFYFENFSIYNLIQLESLKFKIYTNYLLAKSFKLKILKQKKTKKIFLFENKNKKSFFKRLYYFFIDKLSVYIKPTYILDGYFGTKNALHIFLKSRFKILFAKIDYLDFKKNNINKKKNKELRSKIRIKIFDGFDKIYNEFLQNVLPSSYLENFKMYYEANDNKFKNFSKMGTSIHTGLNDNFKFGIIKLKKQNKKIFNIQHGGLIGNRIFAPEDYVNNKFSDLNLYWHDKKRKIGSQYFLDFKFKTFKATNKILLYPSHQLFFEKVENLSNNNHFYLNDNYKLINQLIDNGSFDINIKFFNHKNDNLLKKIWSKKFANKVNILDSANSYKGNIFKNFDLVIINDFSTAFYELIYYKKPFIVLNSTPPTNLKKFFYLHLKELKKLNLWFDDESKLSKFLIENSKSLILNWPKTLKSKTYKKISKVLFATEKFNVNLFLKEISKL